MKALPRVIALITALLVAPCWAGQVWVTTFLDVNPLQDLDVELDGEIVGVTDGQGMVNAPLGAGRHHLRILKNDAQLAERRFELKANEDAEISVGFVDFEQPAEITVEAYDPSVAASGASGVVEGQATDLGGQPVTGATVSLLEAGVVGETDASGAFRLEAPRGRYTLSVSHPDYEMASLAGLRVIANVGVATTIALQPMGASELNFGDAAEMTFGDEPVPEGETPPADGEPPASGAFAASEKDDGVAEIVVLGTYKPRAMKSAADLERFSVAVTDAISVDELLRSGDSDVAAALKRIVGVAVTGGKYANVRGLAGRYISSTLNGSLMPSTDPFRRDVQLDLFPSEILGSIEIQKSFSADLPGDTTGGAIRMTTRGIPEKDEAGVSMSLGYVDGVTGEKLLGYKGGDTDWLGVDDDTRALPGAVRGILNPGGVGLSVSRAEAADEAASLPLIYSTRRDSAEPDFGLSGNYGRRFSRDSGEFGYYAALTYDQSHESRQDARFENVQGDAEGETIWDSFNVAINGYFVAGWEAAQGWNLSSKTIVLRETEDRASIQAGFDRQNAEVFQIDTTLEWIERQYIGEQLESVIPLFGKHELSLRGGFSRTSRESPDRRFYQYRNAEFSFVPFERSYADLIEDAWELGADYEWPIEITDSIVTMLRFGMLANRADRDNELIRLGVNRGSGADPTEDPETLLSADAFANGRVTLRTATAATDSYEAVRETQAAYLATDTELGASTTIGLGARLEDYSLDVDYPYSSRAADSSDPDRDSTDVLPALNLTYRIGEDIQLRGGYSQTVSRPDITEVSVSTFYDAEGRPYQGCPTCEDSTIDNFDLRAEYYFSNHDSVTLAVFYKEIDAPLEVTLQAGAGEIRSFANGESAEVSGIELDGSYAVYDSDSHGVQLRGSLAWIDSEIVLGTEQAIVEGRSKRQLQGQSPFLANAQLAYDHYPSDAKLTLTVNYFDDRIDAISKGAALAPIDEKGRLGVNVAAEKGFFGNQKLSLKIKNLLDAPIERTQGGRVRETYKLGTSLSLGYSLNF